MVVDEDSANTDVESVKTVIWEKVVWDRCDQLILLRLLISQQIAPDNDSKEIMSRMVVHERSEWQNRPKHEREESF